MAKFRTNHSRQGGKSGTAAVRVGLFAAILSALFYLFQQFAGGNGLPPANDQQEEQVEETNTYDGPEEEHYLPKFRGGQVIERQYYTLSYNEKHEQANWVAYVLARERLEEDWVERPEEFMEDPEVEDGSATLEDYRGSGYDRGHLVPAADMAFSEEAIRETFYLSNISPQSRNFNGGIWRELEELTRSWAKKYDKLYVVSGPVLSQPGKGSIGENEVTIPSAYFKVLLDLTEPELKGIAFIIPNEISYDPLFTFVASIDEVEELTGIDFFPELMTRDLEEELESAYNIDLWTFSKQKFDTRVKKWNQN